MTEKLNSLTQIANPLRLKLLSFETVKKSTTLPRTLSGMPTEESSSRGPFSPDNLEADFLDDGAQSEKNCDRKKSPIRKSVSSMFSAS